MSREVRRRITYGIGIPVTAVVIGGALVFALSRLLLASPEELAPFIALLFAVNILVGGALAAMLRSRWAYTLLAIVIIGTIVGGGVVGAVVGPRPIESLVEEAAAEEPPEKGEPPAPSPTAPGERPEPKPGKGPPETDISAQNIAFSSGEMALAANTEVTITFENLDSGVPHNVAIYTDESASEEIFVGDIITGVETADYAFQAPPPGSYFFRCDVHPTIMTGTVAFS